MSLTPVAHNNRINRLEINFNNFAVVTPSKSTFSQERDFSSLRNMFSKSKRLMNELNDVSDHNHLQLKTRPMTIEEVYVYRIRDKFIQK
jgi:hypothetical protein